LIKTIFDEDVYRDYQSKSAGKRIVILTFFSDGVSVSKSSNKQIWPIFIKLNDANCGQEQKTFLYASFYGDSKPDIYFFTKNLIKTLNELLVDGISIEKYGIKIYPMILVSIFDTPARCFS